MARDKDQVKEIEVAIAKGDIVKLVSILTTLDSALQKEVIGAISGELTDAKRRQSMANIKALVSDADPQIREWVKESTATVYVDGMNNADKQITKFGITTAGGKLTVEILKDNVDLQPHLAAVNALISSSYNDFGNGLTGLVRSSERIISETSRRQIRQKLIDGRLVGSSIREIQKEIKDVLSNQGFTALVDRGGKKWSLKRYGEMLSRTHLLRANNEAIINRSLDFEIDIVQVSDHNTDTPICQKYEDNIYSISGNSKEYPKLPTQPPFHPNCKHRILMRPDLSRE